VRVYIVTNFPVRSLSRQKGPSYKRLIGFSGNETQL